jgi:hypothetical protein
VGWCLDRGKSVLCASSNRSQIGHRPVLHKVSNRLNLVGQRFGRLLVLSDAGSKSGRSLWHVLCDCGHQKTIAGKNLTHGGVQSCGCYQKDKQRARVMKPTGEASRHAVWHRYQKDADKRSLPWQLSFDEFCSLTSADCHYCGAAPQNRFGHGQPRRYNGAFIYNGIDRKDSSLGYFAENAVSCCMVCNKAKSKMSYENFVAYLRKAGSFQLAKGASA